MICVCLAEKNIDDFLSVVNQFELAEIRMDLTSLSDSDIQLLFSQPTALIATFRPEKIPEAQRARKLQLAIESGASYVDIEIENDEPFNNKIIASAKKHNCKIIISYHNFNATPTSEELNQIINQAFKQGADIAKIACMVNDKADNVRLLSLYDNKKPVVALGMGELGKITRIASLYLGAPFTMVSANTSRSTAPGQIDYKTLKELMLLIENK